MLMLGSRKRSRNCRTGSTELWFLDVAVDLLSACERAPEGCFFFFPLGQGSSGSLRPRSSMWQFSAIWRIFTAASLKTLCQQLPSSVAPTCHELFILLCMPLQPPEGQEGEGQPAQCLPCGHAGSHTRKGIFFCPNCLDHSLHQGQLYHECMLQDTLHDRVPFQYHVI